MSFQEVKSEIKYRILVPSPEIIELQNQADHQAKALQSTHSSPSPNFTPGIEPCF